MSQQYMEIELGGKNRLLRFDLNGVCELEERLGKGIIAAIQENQIGFNLMRTLYWVGLKWKERGLTVEQTGKWLQREVEENGASLDTLLEPVIKALLKSKLLGEIDLADEEAPEDEDPNVNPA